MTNINWGQFSNNFISGFNSAGANNVQNTPLNANPMPMQQQSTPLEVLLPNYIAQLQQTTNELATLNQQQTMNMLKELLQFPKNFEQLLSQLTTNVQQSAQQSALLLLASNMNLGNLSFLLQNNSKEAMTNLYQMLAQFNQVGMALKDEQINELSKLISFVATASTNDVQTLKATMLIYLPWLPLTDPNAFKLEIASSGSDGSKASDDNVSIMISTENYGNLQAEIYKTDKDGIKIELITSETFPQKEFTVLMKDEGIKYNININFDLFQKEAFNKDKKEKSQTEICVNASSGVNLFLLLISNSVIKNVHIIDSKESLREQRKEKLE